MGLNVGCVNTVFYPHMHHAHGVTSVLKVTGPTDEYCNAISKTLVAVSVLTGSKFLHGHVPLKTINLFSHVPRPSHHPFFDHLSRPGHLNDVMPNGFFQSATPLCVYLDKIHVTKWTRPSFSVFA